MALYNIIWSQTIQTMSVGIICKFCDSRRFVLFFLLRNLLCLALKQSMSHALTNCGRPSSVTPRNFTAWFRLAAEKVSVSVFLLIFSYLASHQVLVSDNTFSRLCSFNGDTLYQKGGIASKQTHFAVNLVCRKIINVITSFGPTIDSCGTLLVITGIFENTLHFSTILVSFL